MYKYAVFDIQKVGYIVLKVGRFFYFLLLGYLKGETGHLSRLKKGKQGGEKVAAPCEALYARCVFRPVVACIFRPFAYLCNQTNKINMKVKSYGLPYMGSKNKLAEEIVSLLPAAPVLYDLFAGGCAVTHRAAITHKFGRIVANDITDIPRLFVDAAAGAYKNRGGAFRDTAGVF